MCRVLGLTPKDLSEHAEHSLMTFLKNVFGVAFKCESIIQNCAYMFLLINSFDSPTLNNELTHTPFFLGSTTISLALSTFKSI